MIALILLLAQDTVEVVTTLPVLAELTRQVGGDRVHVEALASPKQDPHNVVPRPTFMQTAAHADLFVELGMQLDPWCSDIVSNSGNTRIQRGTRGFVTAATNCWKGELPKEISRAWGDVHPDGNPHVWLDPVNAVEMARTIAGGLKGIDPEHGAGYDERAAEFEKRVFEAYVGKECYAAMKPEHVKRLAKRNALMTFIESNEALAPLLSGWAKKAQALKGVKVVSYHKTYFYMAQRFGFSIVEEIEEKPGLPPPPQHKGEVVRTAKAEGVKVILNDSFYPRDAADYVAGETGAKVLITEIDVGEGETYFTLMDRLLDGMIEALK